MKTLTLTVSGSSWPGFRYFADIRGVGGKQVARHGKTRLDIAEFIAEIRMLASKRDDVRIVVVDETLDHDFEEYL